MSTADVVRVGRREVRITNPDKIYFPEPGLTKGDLVAYYLDVADPVLNHVRRRPMHMALAIAQRFCHTEGVRAG